MNESVTRTHTFSLAGTAAGPGRATHLLPRAAVWVGREPGRAWSPGTATPCAQHLDLLQPYASYLVSPDSNGIAHWSLPIPNNPALINYSIGLQEVLLPPSPPPPGMTFLLSNGLRVTIGGAL